MAGRNKKKYPDAPKIQQLTQKLKQQGDITLKEADKIYSLFSENAVKTVFSPISPEYDYKLIQALEEWFHAVTEKIKAGERGNFIFTIHLDDNFYCKNMYQAIEVIDALKEHGNFEDLCNIIMIDEKLYSAFPFKKLLKKDELGAYKIQSMRAGMLNYPIKTDAGTCTISQIMKKFVPVTVSVFPGVLVTDLFELIFNLEISTVRTLWTLGISELKPRILSSFLKYENIPCIAAADTNSKELFVFMEKDKAFITKKALEIPFEKLIENALCSGIIDQKAARKLLNNNPLFKFPAQKFIDASVKYLDKVVQMNVEWKKAREAVEKDSKWLEETI